MADRTRGIEILSVEEVNLRIPLLERIVEDLCDAWVARRKVRLRRRLFAVAARRNSSFEVRESHLTATEDEHTLGIIVRELLAEVHQLGGIVKVPTSGIVNFFTHRRGSLAFLSWRLGEPQVIYWQELEDDTQDRRKLASQGSPSSSSTSNP